MTRWTVEDIPDQAGRSVLITGANSGLGLASARVLAAKGARVLLACRDQAKGEAAVDDVAFHTAGPTPELVTVDLADLDDVRSCAERLGGELEHLDVLMNNAGVMATPRRSTAQGFELQIGTNHLGHFALTGLLLPTLLRAPAPRVVTVSSMGHRMGRIHLDDLSWERHHYQRWLAYGQSKLANLLFTSDLQRRAFAAGAPLLAVAAHPGTAATELTRSVPGASFAAPIFERWVAQPAEMGAMPQLYAATMPDVGPDDYWGPDGAFEQRGYPRKVGRSKAARDVATAERLWDLSEELTGVTYVFPAMPATG